MKLHTAPEKIYLKDYTPHSFKIDEAYFCITTHKTETLVQTKLKMKAQKENPGELILDGVDLVIKSIKLNSKELSNDSDYIYQDSLLTIKDVPQSEVFDLEIENFINPLENKSCEGLYFSGNIFCTQNEPEGLRKITFFIDRPDNMTKFTTKIISEVSNTYLLSNGNKVEEGSCGDGLHYAVWSNPHPMPSYLYAVVVGDLGRIQGEFTTMSGKKVDLQILCDRGNEEKCHHALVSLQKSMKWDEEVYGREYDLDIYMIVAVDSFNMGAMENKGLNIFNSAYVLACGETATDNDYLGIEGVVAHEYFHNWTGNRVTCRDWFQLTLKEGLTVFRDQQFSSDMNSKKVQRIFDVSRLFSAQFTEDAGPNAHPIRPESYIEINNFYTSTIYEKGAEVIRMIYTMLGPDGFRKGTDKYFEMFDGMAVTTEDFLHALSIANNDFDFSQFKNWYSQAGTPKIDVKTNFDEDQKVFTLKIEQSCPPTLGQEFKKDFFFPLEIGLMGSDGKDQVLEFSDSNKGEAFNLENGLLKVSAKNEEFSFKNIAERPVLSINRGFTAPINIVSDQSLDDLYFLYAKDNDGQNRYQAAQILNQKLVRDLVETRDQSSWKIPDQYYSAFGELLVNKTFDPLFLSKCLALPSESILHLGYEKIPFLKIHNALNFVREKLAERFKDTMWESYHFHKSDENLLDVENIGRRELRKTLLLFLSELKDSETVKVIKEQYHNAKNMTEKFNALALATELPASESKEILEDFYNKWKDEPLVIQKWISAVSYSSREDTYNKVLELKNDPVYDKTIPNFVRALYGSFGRNCVHFNHASGRGYKLLADEILELDQYNSRIASGLVGMFTNFKKLPDNLYSLMEVELKRVHSTEGLSKDVFERVNNLLK
jgi:aminopeptidase N